MSEGPISHALSMLDSGESTLVQPEVSRLRLQPDQIVGIPANRPWFSPKSHDFGSDILTFPGKTVLGRETL